jgi:REP element-mobilizing transposase RayT
MIKQEIPPKANSTAILYGAVQPQFGQVRIRQRGRLPHWEKEEGLYFITFHLADSLPRKVLEKLTDRQRVLLAAKRTGARLLPDQKTLIEEFSPRKVEAYFDRGIGSCALRDARVAELVADALRLWHGKRYLLIAWCVMPNHVHVIFRLMAGEQLADVLRSWKSYTARMANRILRRTGAFWQREYYDRLIRGEGELDRAVRYVTNNPGRAGLREWKWVWSAGGEARTTAGPETGATKDCSS